MAKTVNAKAAGIFLRQVEHLIKVGSIKKVAKGVPTKPPAIKPPSLRSTSSASHANVKWGQLGRKTLGDPPRGMTRPHLHHIVYRKGPKAARKYTADSQAILRKYGVDPAMGRENWIWAPNRGHTVDAARLMNEALRKADVTGDRDTVIKVLQMGGKYLFGGK